MEKKNFANFKKTEPEKTTSLKYIIETQKEAKRQFIESENIREQRKIKPKININ